MNLFKKKKYISVDVEVNNNKNNLINNNQPSVPDGMWVKCSGCGRTIYKKEIGKYRICPECGGYFRLKAKCRIEFIADDESFVEFNSEMTAKNPLNYPDYQEKIQK